MGSGNLPDFLVVGAPKSGTTSLYEYLKQHPQVYVNAHTKESNFFVEPKAVLGNGPRYFGANSYAKTMEDYAGLFAEAGAAYTARGEVCPTYLPFYDNTIPNIKRVLGADVKIVIILRNPIDRAFSHYMHNVRDTDEPLSFEAALDAEPQRIAAQLWHSFYLVRLGMYSEQVRAYREQFSQVRIFLYEDLKREGFFLELFEFLGVDPTQRIDTSAVHNVSGRPKHMWLQRLLIDNGMLKKSIRGLLKPFMGHAAKVSLLAFNRKLLEKNIAKEQMKPQTRAYLKTVFEKDIRQLETVIGRDLSHWLA